jgi:predicted PurR-regulated permease PerM
MVRKLLQMVCVGSAAVWAPAVIILVVGGHWWKGLILLGWGAAVVGQIDSLVRPYVISERAKLHPLLASSHCSAA